MNCSVFCATSLDGFIAGKNHTLDWLDEANTTVTKGEDCGYQAFMDSIDALVMGRNTFEKVLTFGNWPYANKPVIVLSSHTLDIPENIAKTVSHSSKTPKELCARLEEEGYKRLYIDGGITIQRFLAAGLIDDLTITLIPMILGGGIPLFGDLENNVQIKHTKTKTFDFGFVQLTYEIK
ncbi:MAG: dihydrofolate reductase [Rhizobiaceae bacterium]|nr:dihydrofolate reductase [Rhizobiaceae bacterium]